MKWKWTEILQCCRGKIALSCLSLIAFLAWRSLHRSGMKKLSLYTCTFGSLITGPSPAVCSARRDHAMIRLENHSPFHPPRHVQHTGDRHCCSLTMFLFPAGDDSFDITSTFAIALIFFFFRRHKSRVLILRELLDDKLLLKVFLLCFFKYQVSCSV